MKVEEAIDRMKESMRQIEVIINNPTAFYKSDQIESGVANMKKNLDANQMAIAALEKQIKEPCKYCTCPEEYIGISAHADTRLFIGIIGKNLRMFDEEYPGYIDHLPIGFCPMCGRELD